MDKLISNGPYQQLNKALDSAAKDNKKNDVSGVPSKLQGAVKVPARGALDAKSKIFQDWVKEPTKKELTKNMALAMQTNRISAPFGAFVQDACPSLEKEKYAEAVNLIAQIAPPPDGATDEAVATHVNGFLPPHEVWSKDGRTPAQRAQYLMEVLESCKQRVFTDQLLDTFSSGSASPPPTAREMWGKVSD